MRTEFRNKITAGMDTMFRHKSARVSWVSGLLLVLVVLVGLSGRLKGEGLMEMVVLMMLIMGVLLGAASLTGLRKYKSKSMVVAALAGIIINGILIYFFAADFTSKPVQARGKKAAVPVATPAK
jgi:hypothetical protein